MDEIIADALTTWKKPIPRATWTLFEQELESCSDFFPTRYRALPYQQVAEFERL